LTGYSRNQVPSHDQLFNPTLKAIRALGGSASIAEIAQRVINDLTLPDGLAQFPHGRGRQTELEYRLAWARTYLKQYGLLENSTRGVWSLTPQGLKSEAVEPSQVVRSVQQEQRKSDTETTEDVNNGSGEDLTESESWRETLAETLRAMPAAGFERLCQRLLRESGFIEVVVTGRSGDQGIDGRGQIRLAGLISFPVIFQCKRWNSSVGPGVVRELRGAMQGRADRGLIITTDRFTRDAQTEATRDGAPPIDLIDGELLIDKLKELKLGVSTRMVEAVVVDSTWFSSV
jgi:restriction system protein